MANQPEVTSYDAGVYQLEVTDPVDGGAGAVSNAPLLALSNRTNYLKKHLDDLEAGTTIPAGIARLNSPAFTGSPTAPTQAAGDNTDKLATDKFVQTAVNGVVTVDISGAATTTLTQAQYGNAIIFLTGAVTANKAVVFPSQSGHWQVINSTTGNFTVTLKTAAGGGVDITRLRSTNIWFDGSGIGLQQTDFVSPALTGSPTTPTPTIGSNNTLIANMAALIQGMAAFGLGTTNAPQCTDLNALNTGGMYFATGSATGLPIAANSSLLHIPYSDVSAALQICSPLGSPARVFYRAKASGNWSAWEEVSKLNSPALTGNPTAPTAPAGDNDLSIANTAFVQGELGTYGIGATAPAALTLATNLDWAKPQGWSGFINLAASKLNGVTIPVDSFGASPGYGMWCITGRRDNSNGYTGIFMDYGTGRAWVGIAAVGSAGPVFTEIAKIGLQAKNFRSIALSVATVTLTAADAGSIVAITGSGGGTLVLPAANSVPAGAMIGIRANNTSVSNNTVKGAGTDTIGGTTGGNANSFVMQSMDCIVLVSDGVSKWDVCDESTAAFVAKQFTNNQSLATVGWQTLPGGLILQWGSGTSSTSGVLAVTFPITYSVACFNIQLTAGGTAPYNAVVTSSAPTKTGFTAYTTKGEPGNVPVISNLGFYWFALGK